uniref:Polysaccharide biosynthesis protein C-terminal domain-containing protein n=1 Tax=Cyclophora tenuis TaxID=216820 RepID=A0A7S1DDB0_CYCTE
MMEPIYKFIHQTPMVVHTAAQWLQIFAVGAPFPLMVRVCQRFLGTQKVVWPVAISTSVSAFIVHPIMLWIFVPTLGFMGSAVAIILTNSSQVILTLGYLYFRPVYHPGTWNGLSWEIFKDAVQIGPMLAFLRLSLGGVLSFGEWCFWGATCFIAGSLGVIPLDIHSVANTLVPTLSMIPLGLSIALSLRMSHLMSESPAKARKLAAIGMGSAILFGIIVSLLFYVCRDLIVRLFTTNEEVIQGCQEIWLDVCIMIILRFIYVINTGIMRSLGMQWRTAGFVFLVLWFSGLPTLVHVGAIGGVTAIWRCLPYFYFALNVLIMICYTIADWGKVNELIKEKKARSEGLQATEETRLV